MYEIAYGTKYESTKSLSRVEIAKLIRADIKAAVKDGTLPKADYSVRCSRGSGINVSVSGLQFPVLSREYFVLRADHATVPASKHWSWRVDVDHSNGHRPAMERLTAGAHSVKHVVERIVWAYNYDGSDTQTDYFNVRFYSSVDLEDDGDALYADLVAAATPAVSEVASSVAVAVAANDARPVRQCIAATGWE